MATEAQLDGILRAALGPPLPAPCVMIVDVLIDFDQHLQSIDMYDRGAARRLAKSLVRRLMVVRASVNDVGTGEVLYAKTSLATEVSRGHR